MSSFHLAILYEYSSYTELEFLLANKRARGEKRKKLLVVSPVPQGHHDVMSVANTFDISTSIMKVCEG